MKIWGLVFGLCLITAFAYADVTAEIVAKDLDDNGNIRVWTQYKIDGIEVESRYPKIDGKFVYCSRYNALNFVEMSDAEIKTEITKDVERHTETLIQKTFVQVNNIDINDNNLSSLIGTKVATETSKIIVGEEEWTVKTNGTKTTKPAITP